MPQNLVNPVANEPQKSGHIINNRVAILKGFFK